MSEQFEQSANHKDRLINCCHLPPKKGMSFIPLRYACVGDAEDLLKKSLKEKALEGKLGAHVKDITLSKAAYTVRLLRTGYLYTLEERSGVLTWNGYMVSARSHLIPFDTNASAPLIDSTDTPLPCEECGNSPLDVTIENAQEVTNYYLLYARHPLHQSKLKEYEDKRVAYAKKGMLQLIKPADFVGNPGNLQNHMLSPDQLSDYVLDYQVFNDWKSGKDIYDTPTAIAMQKMLYPPMIYTEGTLPDKDTGAEATVPAQFRTLDLTQSKLKKKKGVGVALYDPIGITQELNAMRNTAYGIIQEFDREKDPVDTQFTNKHKLEVSRLIEGLKNVVKKSKHNELIKQIIGYEKEQKYWLQRYYKMVPESEKYKDWHDNWQTSYDLTNAHQAEQGWKKCVKELESGPKEEWESNYGKFINKDDITKLKQAYADKSRKGFEGASKFVDDHHKWLSSHVLIDGFNTYYRDYSIAEIGILNLDAIGFRAEADQCFFGIDPFKGYHSLLDKWMVKAIKNPVDKSNLFLRSVCFNHQDIEKALDNAFSGVLTYSAEVASKDIRDVSNPVYNAYFSDFKSYVEKVESAIGFYYKNISNDNRVTAQYLNQKIEFQTRFKLDMVTNEILGSATKNADHKIDFQLLLTLGGLHYVRLGKLTETEGVSGIYKYMIGAKEQASAEKIPYLDEESSEYPKKAVEILVRFYDKKAIKLDAKGILTNKKIEDVTNNANTTTTEIAALKTQINNNETAMNEREMDFLNATKEQKQAFIEFKKCVEKQNIAKRALLNKQEQIVKFNNDVKNAQNQIESDEVKISGFEKSLLLLNVIGCFIAYGEMSKDKKAKAEFYAGMFNALKLSSNWTATWLEKGEKEGERALADSERVSASTYCRLGSGAMGIFAGSIIVYLSWGDFREELDKKESDPTLLAIYGMQTLGSIFLTAFDALKAIQLTSAILINLVGKKAVLENVGKIAGDLLVDMAVESAIPLIGEVLLVITILDFVYEALKPTEMQRWCMKCCFRKSKPASPEDKADYIENALMYTLPPLELYKMISDHYTHPYKSAEQEIEQYYESFDETYHAHTAENYEKSERKRKEFESSIE